MTLRLVPAALVVTLLASCTIPRTGIVAGTATMLAGGMIISSSQVDPPGKSDLYRYDVLGEMIGDLVGGMLVTAGAGILLGSLVGLAQEKPEPTERLAVAVAPAVEPVPAAPRVATPEEIALSGRLQNQLALQARVAARAGRCEAVAVIASKLSGVDHAMYRDLIANDDHVARCVRW
jgi:hypothetical protein